MNYLWIRYGDIRQQSCLPTGGVGDIGNNGLLHFGLFSTLGRRLSDVLGNPRETSRLFQRLSIIIQRFICVLVRQSITVSDEDPDF